MKLPLAEYVKLSSRTKRPQYKLVNMPLKDGFVEVSDQAMLEIQTELRQAEPLPSPEAYGDVVKEAFPPCIKNIIHRASCGINLEHMERFTLAAFLFHVGAEYGLIEELYTRQPDYNYNTTRYQLQDIYGMKYRCPACDTMSTMGYCHRDICCGSVRHPLNCYKHLKDRISSAGGAA